MTRRASEIGCRVRVTPATAPAESVLPSMIEASSSLRPSAVNTAPRPALKSGSSSMSTIVASTASSAVPPFPRTSLPAPIARVSASR